MPPSNMDFSDAPEVLREFLKYQLVIQGKSPATVHEYYYDLRTFMRFLRTQLDSPSTKDAEFETIDIRCVDIKMLEKVNLPILYDFLAFSNINRENDASARARKVSALRSFFKYLTEKKELLSSNPTLKLETPKTRKSLPSYLSLEESKKLLETVERGGNLRDVCMITLFLNCGMRLSELIGINLKDIKEDTIRILGKGNKERTVYLNDSCKTAIANYLRVRPVDGLKDPEALFISQKKNRISDSMVQVIVKKYIEASGLDPEKYSPHKLRHTAATLMYRYADTDIRVLQEILGHSNLNTTQIYTHVENEQMKNAAKKHPLG